MNGPGELPACKEMQYNDLVVSHEVNAVEIGTLRLPRRCSEDTR